LKDTNVPDKSRYGYKEIRDKLQLKIYWLLHTMFCIITLFATSDEIFTNKRNEYRIKIDTVLLLIFKNKDLTIKINIYIVISFAIFKCERV